MYNSKKWSLAGLALLIAGLLGYLIFTGQMSLSGLRSDVLNAGFVCTQDTLRRETSAYELHMSKVQVWTSQINGIQADIARIKNQIDDLE